MDSGDCDDGYLEPLDFTKIVTMGCLTLSLVLNIINFLHMIGKKKIAVRFE